MKHGKTWRYLPVSMAVSAYMISIFPLLSACGKKEPEVIDITAGAISIASENMAELSENGAVSGEAVVETVDFGDVERLSDGSISQLSEEAIGGAFDGYSLMAGIELDLYMAGMDAEPIYERPTYYGYHNLGVANVDNHLNVRESPVDGKLVGKMSNNAGCEILDVVDGWAHVVSGEVEGYVSMDYLLTGATALYVANKVIEPIATVNVNGLRVREQPNVDCPVVTMVQRGEELIVVGQQDEWVELDLDGESAYVFAEYVTIEDKLTTAVTMSELLYGAGVSNTRVDLVEYAKQFVGNRYVWGGSSLTNGCDCSGFTMQIYRHYGVSLPHHAATQATYGTRVDASTIKPGDLVFYAKGGRINHVAIYIGNGQVVHASSPSTGIKISNMYYRTPARMISLLP